MMKVCSFVSLKLASKFTTTFFVAKCLIRPMRTVTVDRHWMLSPPRIHRGLVNGCQIYIGTVTITQPFSGLYSTLYIVHVSCLPARDVTQGEKK